ncbi:MAG: alpha/beta fold hydrolase, partial [Gammaproteobacteria bacterium]
LGEHLAARGIAVHALDHRGHGRSIAREQDTGHFADHDGWEKVIGDLNTVINELKRRQPGIPLLLLGHSMGSFISQAWAIEHGSAINALLLSGSNYGSTVEYRAGRQVARFEKWRLGARGKSALLEFLSFGAFNKAFRPNRTAYDWLSRDASEVDKYVADPLCGFRVSNQLWIDLLGGLVGITDTQSLARIPPALPVYIFGGDQDPVGKHGKGLPKLAAKLREAGLENVTLKLYEGGRHEMLNETNRDEVLADLAGWIDRHLPTRKIAPVSG